MPRQGDVHVCQAEGFGTVLNQDVAQARDEALIDARRRALEQVAGVQVEADTLTRNQMLFDQLVRTQTRGVIQSDRVVEEAPTGDGRYRVRIEAWVKGGDVQDRLEAVLADLSVIVIVPERNLDQPLAKVEDEIVARLGRDYDVRDREHVAKVAARDQAIALLKGDEQRARELGLKFLANVIVVGEASARVSQRSSGIVSAYARVSARVIEAETGRVIGSVSLSQIRGFAADEVTAGERALGAAARQAAGQVRAALDAYARRKERQIEVRVRKLPSVDVYRRFKAYLDKLRWVSGVTEVGYAAGEAVIQITYPEKTLYLATRIASDESRRYRVIEFERSRILVEYRP
jgi:hypothetical protein